MPMSILWRGVFAAAVLMGFSLMPAKAAGPVETSIFAVQGVNADVTGKDAAAAKNQALMDVQVKAFFILVERLGSPAIAARLAEMKPEEIAPFLKSLSIEQESSSPGRYIGKFTVRFLPGKIQKFLGAYGASIPSNQAAPMVILPVWKSAGGPQLWEDNPWRKAWTDLHAEQSLVPLIVPLGDLEDTETISAEEVLAADPVKLEAIRRRYDTKTLLVAIAEPAEGNGIHAVMSGKSPLGQIVFDKIYTAEEGVPEASALLAAQRFHTALIEKYKQNQAKAAAQAQAQAQAQNQTSQSVPVAVPFSSPSEWNGLRSRILAAPNVIGVDVSTLSAEGAVIRLMFTTSLDNLAVSMQGAGLRLSQVGGTWVIQPL
jgi:hypothetical protein